MDFSKINLEDHQPLARTIVSEAMQRTFKDRSDFQKFRNKIIKRHEARIFHNLYFVKAYEDLVKEGKIEANEDFLNLIQKRSVRTMSGVAPVTVLMKPWPCPGRCVYCPTDVRMPKSYLPSQPAAQRGLRQRFDPYSQVYVRLKALEMTGHEVSKVELRILGGTFSSYAQQYQTWFVKRCLQAMNEYKKKMVRNEKTVRKDELNTLKIKSLGGARLKLEDIFQENETAPVRCIGINIETRPDAIDMGKIRRLRQLGVTKVEMGVQTLDGEVQKKTKRGHDLQSVQIATKLLKDAGFKIGYHMMPNLPGATVEMDKKMVGELFTHSAYQPDYLKIYPCVVIPKTQLAVWETRGAYKSYDDKTLEDVLYENLKSVPEWCRIDRVARDIPADEIQSGFKVSNIRQILEERLIKEGNRCRDIRSREIGGLKFKTENVKLKECKYEASGGTEMFLSYEDEEQDKIIALLRLRLPNYLGEGFFDSSQNDKTRGFVKELRGAALIREVHVYGKQTAVGAKGKTKQHVGWGTKLLQEAEKLSVKNGYSKIAVIAGIGTREYYKKFGYELKGTYMLKDL